MNVLPVVASTTGTAAKAAKTPSVAFFSELLTSGIGRLNANANRGVPAAGAGNASTARLQDRLAGKIQTLLDAGVSFATIVSHLAQAIGAQLGGTDSDARAAATQAVARALAPPGDSPPARGDGARALAGRLRTIAERLTGASDEQGQQLRSPGTILDADTAKDSPAPTTTSATPDTGSLVPVAQLPGAAAFVEHHVSAHESSAADARRVATDAADRVGTGGTTFLGRILSRAANAALERSANSAVAGAGTVDAANPNTPGAQLPNDPAALLQRFDAMLSAVPTPQATIPPDVRILHRDDDPDAVTAASAAAAPAPGLVAVHASDAASAAPAPPAPPADPFHVVDQVIRGVFVRSVGENSEIRLRLVPEHLGDVTVKLVVHRGAVDATLLTQSAGARDALAGGQAQLTRALADAGLKLQSFSVDLNGNAFAGFPQHQQPGEHRTLPMRRFAASSDAEDGGDATEALTGAGTQDVPPAPGALDTLV